MKELALTEVRSAVRGRFLARPHSPQPVTAVVTDSRQARPGALFVALAGQRVDGHQFVADALDRGAVAALVGRDPGVGAREGAILAVDDPLVALGDLARYYRGRVSATVVAITGSNGKTTTKEMVAHLLRPGLRVVKAQKSFNNFVGLPLTIFDIDPTTDLAVLELGTSAPGEIRRLAAIAQPHVGVITNIGLTHLEGLGSLAGVAQAKAELLDALQEDGTAVLNWDDDWCRRIVPKLRGKLVTFGLTPEADVFATEVVQDARQLSFKLNGVQGFVLPVTGLHNLSNALAAVAVCRRLGLTPAEVAGRFAGFRLPAMRFEELRLGQVTIINDAYNANPVSMSAALSEFGRRQVAGRKFLVAGDMKELGADSPRFHQELGLRVAAQKLDGLFVVGEFAGEVAEGALAGGFPASAIHTFATLAELAPAVLGELQPGDVVLLKGSRAMELERLVEVVRDALVDREVG